MIGLKLFKAIQSLPAILENNAIYLLRKGVGVEIKVADKTGAFAFGLGGCGFNVYSKDGLVTNGGKIWTDVVKPTSKGAWTVDFSSAGFTKIPRVLAISENVGTDNGNAAWATVDLTNVTKTTANGRCLSAVCVGLLAGNIAADSSNRVTVIAIGE